MSWRDCRRQKWSFEDVRVEVERGRWERRESLFRMEEGTRPRKVVSMLEGRQNSEIIVWRMWAGGGRKEPHCL